jgi:hypothetical protein
MLKVNSEFLGRLRDPIDWKDLRYAYAHQLIDAQTVIDHAWRVFSESRCDNEDIIAITSAKVDDPLGPIIDRVAGPGEPTPDLIRKWALIIAAFIMESDISDKLEAIEEVYSSFDYPEELAGMVRYMPMTGPNLGSKAANEERMLNRLKELSAKIVVSD